MENALLRLTAQTTRVIGLAAIVYLVSLFLPWTRFCQDGGCANVSYGGNTVLGAICGVLVFAGLVAVRLVLTRTPTQLTFLSWADFSVAVAFFTAARLFTDTRSNVDLAYGAYLGIAATSVIFVAGLAPTLREWRAAGGGLPAWLRVDRL
jgi:hypothetical protein